MLNKVHHVAIICSDYSRSKLFYTTVLGFEIVRETYRKERKSFKLDLSLHGTYMLELFSFPDPPARTSHPEAAGLRHLAFEVTDLDSAILALLNKHVASEPVRIDETTGKRFTFITDPDGLPIELYEK